MLCAGDAIKSAEALEQTGIPAAEAERLAEALAKAEAKLPPERVAQFATFEGMIEMGAEPGEDGAHDHHHH